MYEIQFQTTQTWTTTELRKWPIMLLFSTVKYAFFTFVLSLRNEKLAVVQIFKKDVLSYLEIMKFMNKQISPMK